MPKVGRFVQLESFDNELVVDENEKQIEIKELTINMRIGA
jgi:hypothetical protein